LAQEMGLVALGRVALDGSKFKAAADRDMAYRQMGTALREIEGNLKQLKEDLAKANAEEATELESKLREEFADQAIRRERIARAKAAIEADFSRRGKKRGQDRQERARKALVDPDSLSLSSRRGGYMHGYNVQAAVDEKAQIVVACDLQDSASDSSALPGLVDQVKANCGEHGAAYLADSGYQSLANLKKIEAVGSTPVLGRKASKAERPVDEEAHEQVTRGAHDREYFCKEGRRLDLACRTQTGHLQFRMAAEFCRDCPQTRACHLFGKKHPEILDDPDRETYTSYLAWSRTPEWKELYRRRPAIVEPVFGNIKNKGIRIFVRGKNAVSAWWNIATTAHNLEKVVGYLRAQPA
jgi:hypothetical protein